MANRKNRHLSLKLNNLALNHFQAHRVHWLLSIVFLLAGSHANLFGLRKPEANVRCTPVFISTSQTRARSITDSMPFSAILLFEPIVTYNLVPSAHRDDVFSPKVIE